MKVVTPKDFFTSPLGKLILLVLIMLGCWCVLCVYLSANSAVGTWFPTDAQMDRAVKDIKSERVKYNTASAEMAEIEKLRAKYNSKLATFWQVERDGTPETELRTLLSDTAAVLDITMTRLDNVRISSKITDELYYADLSFQFTDTYDKIVTFISQIESTQPRLGWRTLTINAENNRNRNNNNMLMGGARILQTSGSSSGTTTTVQQKYRLDATVRVIRYMPVADPNAPATAAAGKAQTQTGTAAQGAAATTATKQQGATAQPAQGATGATAAVGAVGDPTKGKPTPAQGAAGVTPGAAPNANAGVTANQVTQGPQGAQQMQPGMGGMQGGMGMQPGMGGMQGGFGGMDMQGGFGGMQGGFGGMQGGFGGMQGGFGGMQGGFGGMDMQGGFGGMQGGMGMQPGNMQQGGARPAANNAAQNQRPAANAGAANNVAPAAQQAQQGAARN